MMQWKTRPTALAVAEYARDRIVEAAEAAIAARGEFRIVLAGGGTPEACYGLLAGMALEWSAWQVFFGDERCLPPGDAERNSRMAAAAWLDRVAIPAGNVRPIPAEAGPEAGARHYGALLEGLRRPQGPLFDVVLLGLGEDGHTASLFPGQAHPPGPLALPVHDAPKPPPERVSLSAGTLGDCRLLLFLVTGAGKRDAVARWRAGEAIPAAGIRPLRAGEVVLDPAADGTPWVRNGAE